MPEFLKEIVYLNWFIKAVSQGKSKLCLMKQSDQFVTHFPSLVLRVPFKPIQHVIKSKMAKISHLLNYYTFA